jgi:hypothetical protein
LPTARDLAIAGGADAYAGLTTEVSPLAGTTVVVTGIWETENDEGEVVTEALRALGSSLGIEVIYRDRGTLDRPVDLAFGNDPGDIIISPEPSSIEQIAAARPIVDVGSYLDEAYLRDSYGDYLTSLTSINGHSYGVFVSLNAKSLLWYNGGAFGEAGYTDPSSWDEVLSLSDRMVLDGHKRNQVLGLEAVLADGTVVGRVPGLRKDNTGYDLAGLLTGSEGTLAVITRVHLALVPYLPDRVVALCALEGFADALTVSAALRKRVDSLVALEVFFADGLALVCEHAGLGPPFGRSYAAYLLIECAGRAGSAARLVDELAGVLAECPQVQATAVAVDAASRERLWAYRERHTEAINAAGIPHKLDVTLPFDQLVDFERAVRARLNEVTPRARVVCFGHLGDGNLHVNVLGPPPDDSEVDDAVFDLVAAMGGSISAEHGIGIAKRAALERLASPADIAAMRAIKLALDPRGILNPGVLLAP